MSMLKELEQLLNKKEARDFRVYDNSKINKKLKIIEEKIDKLDDEQDKKLEDIIKKIKENNLYVKFNYLEDISEYRKPKYRLYYLIKIPDGDVYQINAYAKGKISLNTKIDKNQFKDIILQNTIELLTEKEALVVIQNMMKEHKILQEDK